MMPEKVTIEEKAIEMLAKAKETLEHYQHLNQGKDVTGEEVEVKRPSKNPKEEKVENPAAGEVNEVKKGEMSDTIKKAVDDILKTVNDLLEKNKMPMQSLFLDERYSKRSEPVGRVNDLYVKLSKLTADLKAASERNDADEAGRIVDSMKKTIQEMKRLRATSSAEYI